MRFLLAMTVVASSGCSTRSGAAAPCTLEPDDERWLKRAVAAWGETLEAEFGLTPTTPSAVFFDARCTFSGPLGGPLVGVVHGGRPALPNGRRLAVEVVSFTSSTPAGTFFVMALPSVWARQGISSRFGLSTLLVGVLLHELLHGLQAEWASRRLEALAARGLAEDVTDDSLQERWSSEPEYVASMDAERRALFLAAEGDRSAAVAALELRAARQTRFLSDRDAVWREADDVFVTLEGVGQYVAYRWFARQPGVERASALAEARRGGRFWSQDEGLGLALALEAMAPEWKRQVLGSAARPLPALLEAVLAR
jgi:hypothetical protein